MSARDWDHAHLVQSYHVACLRSALRVLVRNARDRIGLSVSEIQRVFTHAASGKAQRDAAVANKNGVGSSGAAGVMQLVGSKHGLVMKDFL